MKYAEEMKDITNAFKNSPLEDGELKRFYCDGTMEFRTGDKYESPTQDIYEACQVPSGQNAFLLLGHKGCGKSTELNKMSVELMKAGYYVFTISCINNSDILKLTYTDLLILLGEALLKIADKSDCHLHERIKKQLISFWTSDMEEERSITGSSDISAEAGIQAESPKFLSAILQVFANIKADLKYSEERRTTYRQKIRRYSSEWLVMLREIADEITKKLNGKQPIIIFEDLDKIDARVAWDVFGNYAATLTGVSFPIIYTFPIALSYDPRFAALEGYFIPKTLPMIKQETINGETFQKGIDIIVKIIEKRAKLDLFEEHVLETLIKKTGGSLRDLFYAINASAQRAIRRDSDTISTEDIQRALEELKTSLTRRIERKHYQFLRDIYEGNRQIIEDKNMLLEMLEANAVLEYNGKRWHNVHPLVSDFLLEQGIIKK